MFNPQFLLPIPHSSFLILHSQVCPHFQLEPHPTATVLCLTSPDGTNRLTRACVLALTVQIRELAEQPRPLILTGNYKFFSAGAELEEIVALTGPAAYAFSHMGQALMNAIETFPAPVLAAVSGYCMGGGLDLALACHRRIASPHAIFGHRGATLGLITGWGGTQRLPRLVGKARALQMMMEAEKIHAQEALRIGLVDSLADDPVNAALEMLIRREPPPKPVG
jgi:enoyl-CoA hydratase/carnithine racemase